MLEFITNLFKTNSKSDTSRKEGTVKFFNGTKGFGFIKVNDTEEEIFVHKSDVHDRIRDKDKVTFIIEQEEKGPKAVEVRKVKK